MALSSFNIRRLSCAYFFAVPGLLYGLYTSRLPAMKQMVGANDGQIGIFLLCFGLASFCGLISSNGIAARFGIRKVMGLTSLLYAIFLSLSALALNYWQMVACGTLAGLAGGVLEVAMNAQGMELEHRYNRLCMGSLHASFSLGGVTGSLAGSLCAWLNMSPFANFVVVSVFYLGICFIPYRFLINPAKPERAKEAPGLRLPLFVVLCGLLSMLCYVSEGSVADWGSILLHSVKNAAQNEAALVYAFFCGAMVAGRLLADRMRQLIGDVRLLLIGGMLGAGGMSLVLLASPVWLCLGGYIIIGLGFAPLVPILFSKAGSCPGVSTGRASSIVSVMSYTGLLVFPPVLGMLGDRIGLDNALWIIVGCCLAVAIFGPLLPGRPHAGARKA